MESICVAFRLDFESQFLCSSLGFKASETYTIEENNWALFLWGTSSPKYHVLAIRGLHCKKGQQKGAHASRWANTFQGLFLQVLLPLIRSWTRCKWLGTLCQFLVGSHRFSSEASHENLAPFDFIPWKLWLNSQGSNITFFFSFQKDCRWKALFYLKCFCLFYLKCLKLKI